MQDVCGTGLQIACTLQCSTKPNSWVQSVKAGPYYQPHRVFVLASLDSIDPSWLDCAGAASSSVAFPWLTFISTLALLDLAYLPFLRINSSFVGATPLRTYEVHMAQSDL